MGSCNQARSRRATIAKNQNTYAKKKREMDKKHKAQEKLNRRLQRKQAAEDIKPPESAESEAPETADEST